MSSSENSKGTSLIELCVSLSIGGVILLAVYTQVHQLGQTAHRQHQIYEARASYYSIISLLSQGIRGLDLHSFNIPPRVHPRGQITLTSGMFNMVLSHPTLYPHHQHDAITILNADAMNGFWAEILGQNNRALELYGCPFNRTAKLLKIDRNFVGLSSHGMYELSLDSTATLNGRCRRFVGSMVESMSLQSPEPMTSTPLLLIPIKKHFTLYVDKNNRMRYLSHRGIHNSLNQPLASDVSSFSVEQQSSLPFDVSQYHVTLQIHDHSPVSKLVIAHYLERNRPDNLYMNGPL